MSKCIYILLCYVYIIIKSWDLTHGPAGRSSLTIMVLFQEMVTLKLLLRTIHMKRNRKFHVKLFCRTIIYLQKTGLIKINIPMPTLENKIKVKPKRLNFSWCFMTMGSVVSYRNNRHHTPRPPIKLLINFACFLIHNVH